MLELSFVSGKGENEEHEKHAYGCGLLDVSSSWTYGSRLMQVARTFYDSCDLVALETNPPVDWRRFGARAWDNARGLSLRCWKFMISLFDVAAVEVRLKI